MRPLQSFRISVDIYWDEHWHLLRKCTRRHAKIALTILFTILFIITSEGGLVIKGDIQGSEWLIPVISNIPLVPLTYCRDPPLACVFLKCSYKWGNRLVSPCNYCHHPWCVGDKSYHKALLIMVSCDGSQTMPAGRKFFIIGTQNIALSCKGWRPVPAWRWSYARSVFPETLVIHLCTNCKLV